MEKYLTSDHICQSLALNFLFRNMKICIVTYDHTETSWMINRLQGYIQSFPESCMDRIVRKTRNMIETESGSKFIFYSDVTDNKLRGLRFDALFMSSRLNWRDKDRVWEFSHRIGSIDDKVAIYEFD